MKPWQRALKREPMCVFVEGVVDGYSPLNAKLNKLVSAGRLLRSLPWWADTSFATAEGPRGHVVGRGRIESGEELAGSWHQQRNGAVRKWTAATGEMAWK